MVLVTLPSTPKIRKVYAPVTAAVMVTVLFEIDAIRNFGDAIWFTCCERTAVPIESQNKADLGILVFTLPGP